MPYTQTCPTCRGTKKAHDPEWLEFAEQLNLKDRNTIRDCPTCERRGFVPTRQGKRILDLVACL